MANEVHKPKIQQTATFVVAASDASYTKAADYVCTGSNDDVQINAAITALPSAGGKIILSEGKFTISAAIAISISNVTLEGQGNATQIFVANSANLLAA